MGEKSGINVLHSHLCVKKCTDYAPLRSRRLNGVMLEDGQDKVALYWEPKGKSTICVASIKSFFIFKNMAMYWDNYFHHQCGHLNEIINE